MAGRAGLPLYRRGAYVPGGCDALGAWQPPAEMQSLGIGSLVAKVLCTHHNSGLSGLDAVAAPLLATLNAMDKDPASLPPITKVDGELIERWFLKVVCGLTAMKDEEIPPEWLQALQGGEWPIKWGLYVPSPSGPQVLVKEFSIETLLGPNTRVVKIARFRMAGVHFNLLLDRPPTLDPWGHRHARSLIFRSPGLEKRIEFIWKFRSSRVVIYTKTGMSSETPPQFRGWKSA